MRRILIELANNIEPNPEGLIDAILEIEQEYVGSDDRRAAQKRLNERINEFLSEVEGN